MEERDRRFSEKFYGWNLENEYQQLRFVLQTSLQC